ncbi:MAG TPA: DNA internalization-related competence protein ComEC/Rec2 [Rhodanobacteraceae bacterium]|nr:DNA internalization-related competence protein ComEC/Rec2 [Rhodanobacteraceae bacterium]
MPGTQGNININTTAGARPARDGLTPSSDAEAIARRARSCTLGVVAIAVVFLVGVVFVQCLPHLPPHWLDGLLVALALSLLWRCPRLRWLAVLVLAVAWASWRGDLAMQARLPRHLEKSDIDVVGTVTGLPRNGRIANRFVLRVEHASLDGKPLSLKGDTRVSWYGAPEGRPAPCTRWHLRLRLKRPRTLANPGGFDSERSALERREVATGYVRAKGDNHKLGQQAWCVDRLRADVSKAIAKAVPDAHEAHLLQSLAVGDTRGLSDHDWDVARANGISHLLAISGFHVGVAALVGAWLIYVVWWLFPGLGRCLPRQIAQGMAALATAVGYGALAGFGLPTDRTLLMIAVVALARCFRRSTGGMQTLAMALLVIVAWDPLSVLSAGFWLSFAGVAFLMIGLARPRSLWGHVKALGATQLLMTVALLPLTLWFFGQASVVGALSNLIAVPVVSLAVVPLALAGTLLLPIWPSASGMLWQVAAWIMHLLWKLLEQMAQWPGAHWYPPAITATAMLLATLGALWLFLPRGMPARWLGLLLFLPLLLPRLPTPQEGAFRMWVIDVGQGLSVLVRTRHHAMVYDAGARYPSGFDLGRVAVVPMLHALGVHRLGVLMISHGDNDHAGGAPAVAAAFPQARQLSGEPGRVGLHMRQCHAGQHWKWDGVNFRVISPEQGRPSLYRDNDRSCVLLVGSAAGRVLLTGDISSRIEPRVAQAVGKGPPLVLLVPHHGSKSSSSKTFIAALQPQLAIASAGWLNRFHHPAKAVVERYAEAGVPFFNTATSGAVEVVFPARASPYIAARWRLHENRYWRE